MRPIIKQVGAIFACTLFLYILILGFALAVSPPPDRRGVVDVQTAASTIFMTEPKYIYLNRAPLSADRNNVILVGGSNVVAGFALADLNRLIHVDAIHNLGLGGANVTELRQVMDLVYEVQNHDVRRQDTFVIGLWYGLFGENRLHWFTADRVAGDTDLDLERYRYGFERRTPDGPATTVPSAYRDVGVMAIYPLLFLDRASRIALRWISPVHAKTPDELDAVNVTEQEKDEYLRYWQTMMGPPEPSIFDEQFSVLGRICDEVLAQGSRLLLIDLPLPQWHKARSPYQAMYEARMHQVIDRLRNKAGFGFLDMGDLDDNADFYDEVHPKPRVLTAWATRLAGPCSLCWNPRDRPETEPLNGNKYISSMPARALPGTTDDNR
jgi:hypothetical protein